MQRLRCKVFKLEMIDGYNKCTELNISRYKLVVVLERTNKYYRHHIDVSDYFKIEVNFDG